MAKSETSVPEENQAKAEKLMLEHGLKSIWMTSDGQWFSSAESCDAHNIEIGGEKPQVFNQKTT